MNAFLDHLIEEFHLPLQNPVLIFSLVLFIILLSPILLRKLNVPSIIGLIISGVVIGPHGFNILEKTAAIDLFSTIGLLYIMFIAGLELDLNQFKLNRNKSLTFGFLTFAIPLLIGFPVCYSFLGFDFTASLLTASMFATHTLVAYPIVSKLGISKNRAVSVAVGGTILTDTAVLILLAVIIGSNDGSLDQAFWIRLIVSLLIFSGIMFFIIPRIAKWFFRKLESEKHSHYIFVLAVVFFAAFLAEVAGVEPIIGAFVAGLSLNKLIPHSSPLMNRVEFIGNSLFIPFFLISVGMLVNISVIFQGNQALIVAGTLTVVALFSKWLAAFFTRKIFKFSRAEGQLIFGLSSAHAAATLAVILVGYKAGILNENILNGTIILILITCVVASFVSEKAAKKIVIDQNLEVSIDRIEDHSTLDAHFVVPSVEIADVDKLLNLAIYMKGANTKQPISILTVVPDDSVSEQKIKKMKPVLEQKLSEAKASDIDLNLVMAIDHNVASGIIRKSREILADILILSWPKKQGFLDNLLGDSFDKILAGFSKTVMFGSFSRPFTSFDQVIVVLPAFAEYETGFPSVMKKIKNLATELSLPILIYCNEQTQETLQEVSSSLGLKAKYKAYSLSDVEDFTSLTNEIVKTDLLLFVAARKGTTSYQIGMDHFADKIEKQFPANDSILIYPNQFGEGFSPNDTSAFNSVPLNKGFVNIQKLFGNKRKKRR
jgi:Kef-type K+ transport system membrane component KefB